MNRKVMGLLVVLAVLMTGLGIVLAQKPPSDAPSLPSSRPADEAAKNPAANLGAKVGGTMGAAVGAAIGAASGTLASPEKKTLGPTMLWAPRQPSDMPGMGGMMIGSSRSSGSGAVGPVMTPPAGFARGFGVGGMMPGAGGAMGGMAGGMGMNIPGAVPSGSDLQNLAQQLAQIARLKEELRNVLARQLAATNGQDRDKIAGSLAKLEASLANVDSLAKLLERMAPSAGGAPKDPEMQDLARQLAQLKGEERNLLDRYAAAANDQERGKIKEMLAKLLDKQFDLQQHTRHRELEAIEARVQRVRALIAKRQQTRATIIQQRLTQLIAEAEGLGWTPPEETPATKLPMSGGFNSGSSPGASGGGAGPSLWWVMPSSANLVPANKIENRLRKIDVPGPTTRQNTVRALPSSTDRLTATSVKKGDAETKTEIRVFTLTNLNPTSLPDIILSALPEKSKNVVHITADKGTSNLFVSGPHEDLLLIESMVRRLDAEAGAGRHPSTQQVPASMGPPGAPILPPPESSPSLPTPNDGPREPATKLHKW